MESSTIIPNQFSMITIGTITKYGRYEGGLSKVNRELKWSDFKVGVWQVNIVVEFEFYA